MTMASQLKKVSRAVTSSNDDLIKARELDGGVLTQDGVSRVFTERYRDELRYDHDARTWYSWAGSHWKRDGIQQAFRYARELGREQSERGNDVEKKFVRRTAFAAGVEKFAQTDEAFAVTSEVWDQNPYFVGTPGGTIDLKTGRLRPASPDDMITKITSVTPSEIADCKLFQAFLQDITRSDGNIIEFLQRFFGYCLSADTREQILCFFTGPGGNGKGVLVNVVSKILGAYSATATMEAFTASKFDRHTTELAMLRGARLVSASETEEGRLWAEARIKRLTGGDEITARFMHKDNFTYRPTFKILVSGNHRPLLRCVDDAIRRRMVMVPFDFKAENPDRGLEDRLMAEAPAILRWMVEGFLKWQRHGLNRPDRIIESTRDYLASQDVLGDWLQSACELGPDLKSSTSALYSHWAAHARDNGDEAGSPKSFAERLQNRGFAKEKNVPTSDGKYVRGFKGLSVRGRSS
jgi:putative DNA primase/helicase